MPKVEKITDTEGRPGYSYNCQCGKPVKLYWHPSENSPEKLEVCFDCLPVLSSNGGLFI